MGAKRAGAPPTCHLVMNKQGTTSTGMPCSYLACHKGKQALA
jgi:hypothetical protein